MVIKVKYNGEWVKIPYLSSDHGQELVEEAPKDNKQYARQDGTWTVVNIPEVDFTEVYEAIDTKVDKVDGKGLSTNDYITADKTKVTNVNEVIETAARSVTATGISITLDKRNLVTNAVENIELDLPASTTALAGLMLPSDKTKLNGIAAGAEVNVNADWNATEGDALILNKPTIPTVDVTKSYVDTQLATKANAMNSALGNKVDKVSGKALSTNDYTTAEKNKLAGIAASANNYSLPAATSSVLGGVKTSTGITNSSGTISVTYGTAAGTACQGNDSRLSNSRPASDVSAWAKASTKPTYTWTEITSKPSWIGSSKPTYTASEVGALASGGTAVNASKVANSFIFKVAGGSTEGTNLYTFNGSAAKTINVVAGSNVTLTPTAGQLSISAKDTTYAVATTSANGLMSSAMVTKLNGVATNANNYSLPTATGSVLGGVKTGSNITNSSGTISLSSGNVTSALGYTPVKNESGVASIRVMTQSAYDALSSKSATTLYIITG